MAATLTRLIFFASGELHAIVNADNDSELAPHTGPIGAVYVDVPRKSYVACKTTRDHMALALPLLSIKDVVFASAVTAKIDAIDLAIAADIVSADAAKIDGAQLDVLP